MFSVGFWTLQAGELWALVSPLGAQLQAQVLGTPVLQGVLCVLEGLEQGGALYGVVFCVSYVPALVLRCVLPNAVFSSTQGRLLGLKVVFPRAGAPPGSLLAIATPLPGTLAGVLHAHPRK